ncbi:MAG: acyltransferase [Acidobacteriaceae bacterium]|nr:acyltransferase [Acidobacteriaceae bacterium]
MRRIPSLDGLRAISILLVLAGHWALRHHQLTFLAVYGNVGVRIFFVISGYLITTLLLREEQKTGRISLRDFYIRRAYRIFPAAVAFLIPALILYWHEVRWYDLGAVALYLVNFDMGAPWFIGHLWSLSVEEQFYVLWPAVFRNCVHLRAKILIGIMALTPIYSAVCYYFKVRGGGYGTFPAVADNIAVGCLLAFLADRIPVIGHGEASAMMLVIALVPQFPANTPIRTLLMLFVLWPLMHLSIAGLIVHAVQSRYWILNWAPAVFLGKISYSLYLWQQLFFYRPDPWPIYLALPLALIFACSSYYVVERPMLRIRDVRQNDVFRTGVRLATAGD